MNFWGKLFGRRKAPKLDLAQRAAVQPGAYSNSPSPPAQPQRHALASLAVSAVPKSGLSLTPSTSQTDSTKAPSDRPNWFAEEKSDGRRYPRLGPHNLGAIDISGVPLLSNQEWAACIANEPREIFRTLVKITELENIETTWDEAVDRVHGRAADGKSKVFEKYIDVRCPKCRGHTFVTFVRNIKYSDELRSNLASGAFQCNKIARELQKFLPIYNSDDHCDSDEFQFLWLGDVSNATARHLDQNRLNPPEGSIFIMPLEPGLLGACRVIRKGDVANMPSWDRFGVTINGLLVIATAWTGSNFPNLTTDEQNLRRPLIKTFGNWRGSQELSWVNKNKLPDKFVFLGILPVTSEERRLESSESNAWEWIAEQVLKQLRSSSKS